MPLLASVVPILGAVALWLVTGSVLSLWLAALGPLIAGATLLDGARAARRDRRRAEQAARTARERVGQQIAERHAEERGRTLGPAPGCRRVRCARRRDLASGSGQGGTLVVGRGVDASELRVDGGGDDAEAAEIRASRRPTGGRADRGGPSPSGIAVTGSAVLAGAVVRSLVAQLAMTLPPGELRIVGPLRGENSWAEQLPHRRAGSGPHASRSGHRASRSRATSTSVIVRAEAAAPGPRAARSSSRCTRRSGPRSTREARCARSRSRRSVSCRPWRWHQELTARATAMLGTDAAAGPGRAWARSSGTAPVAARGQPHRCHRHGESGELCVIDLVTDGPHAVVAGVTGSGKSELLITWILALCASHSTEAVSFLLADFKGGTAFDALAGVPHVTGVLTDLDGSGARRAIESLRAEVRWREAELARVGARDVLDPRVDVPRLVIVVDEFAALLGEHPELHAVFTDVAARGRALGMHLILGTQRPSGVVRESLLANCPLRISLRVTDPVDSRAVIGTDEAALLPGGPEARGIALVRSAADRAPRRVRIALSSSSDCDAITCRRRWRPTARPPRGCPTCPRASIWKTSRHWPALRRTPC